MKRSSLKRIGKVGRANLAANKKIAELWKVMSIYYCELLQPLLMGGFPVSCIGNMLPLQNVHRHKRLWYRNQPEKLSDYKQVVRGCTVCHNFIEHNAKLTEAVFMELRGGE